MTPAELDLVMNGAFIFKRSDGSRFATLSRKLADYGVELVGRAGRLAAADLNTPASEYLERINADLAIAAGSGTAETVQLAQCEASQSGAKRIAPKGAA